MSKTISPVLERAIYDACKANSQSDSVAEKIVAWVEESSERSLDGADMQQFVELIISVMKLKG